MLGLQVNQKDQMFVFQDASGPSKEWYGPCKAYASWGNMGNSWIMFNRIKHLKD